MASKLERDLRTGNLEIPEKKAKPKTAKTEITRASLKRLVSCLTPEQQGWLFDILWNVEHGVDDEAEETEEEAEEDE